MCFMDDSDADDNDEVTPSYDVLSARCDALFEQLMSQDGALELTMAKNKDLKSQVENLTLELENAKTLEPDECLSCNALHSEFAKMQHALEVTSQQLVNARSLEPDECLSCLALHSIIAKMQTAHDDVLHQLENARTELIESKSAPCVNCLDPNEVVVYKIGQTDLVLPVRPLSLF